MFSYKNILRDKNIIEIYRQIDLKTNYVVSHGLQHMNNVVKHSKALAKALKLTKQQQRVLLVAAVLHDIGRLEDNASHHICGARFAKEYLSGKLENDEIEIVAYAITYHCKEGSDFEKMDDVAWCLTLADKLDFEKGRLVKDLLSQANTQKFDLYKQTKKIKIKVDNNILNIEIFTDFNDFESSFKKYKEGCRELYEGFTNHFKLDTFKFIIRK